MPHLQEALTRHGDKGAFIVEDTSLHFDCLGGLPGPLIKWFLKILGNPGLYGLCAKYGEFGAEGGTTIGYARSHEEVYFFEGVRRGRIVAPRGESNFGWDSIFELEGLGKTQAELTREEKNAVSMRGEAARKLRDFLKEKGVR